MSVTGNPLRIILFTSIAAIVAYVGFRESPAPYSSTPTRSPANAPAIISSSPPAKGDASHMLRFHPQAGIRYTYQFDRRILLRGFSEKMPEIAYQGKFRVDILRIDAEKFDAHVSQEMPISMSTVAPSYRAEIPLNGKDLTLYGSDLRTEEQIQAANLLKDLIALWVFPLETDTAGKYVAHFETSATHLTKKKLRYLENKNFTAEITRSSHRLEWDPSRGMPHSIAGEETTTLGTGALSLTSDSRYSMRFESAEAIPQAGANLASLTQREDLALSEPMQRKGSIPINPRYASIPWSELANQLAAIDALTSTEQLALFGALAGNLRAHPETLARLLRSLPPSAMAAGAGSDLFKIIVGTLATVGTAEAQAALLDVYRNPNCDVSAQGAILSALTTTQAPLNSKTLGFLAGETQSPRNPDLAHGAAWALGSAIQSDRDPANPSVQTAIMSIQQAWNQTSQATDPRSEKLALLDAMGNSGRPEFTGTLANIIQASDDLTLKSKAIFALRFNSSTEALNLMGQALSDPTATIRYAAASAIQTAPWNPAFQPALEKCIAAETANEVKNICQNALRAHSEI